MKKKKPQNCRNSISLQLCATASCLITPSRDHYKAVTGPSASLPSRPLTRIRLCCGDVFRLESVVVDIVMVEVQRTDCYKQLEQFLVCLHPSECIEGLFSVQVPLHSSAQMCVQRVLNKLYEAFEVVALWTDSYKHLEWLIVCLRPSECIEGWFSGKVHLHPSAQMCIQR